MRKAFVILTSEASAPQQEAILTVLKGWGWWHFFPQGWLVVDGTGTWSATALRDRMSKSVPGLIHYIFEIPSGADYAGFAPAHWQDWLKTEWQKK